MTEPVVIAIIGFCGVIVGALIPILWQLWSRRNSRLIVTYSEGDVFAIPTPPDDSHDKETVENDHARFRRELLEATRAMRRTLEANRCSTLELTNNSPKSLMNLTMVPSVSMAVKIADADPVQVAADEHFSLGTLQPGRTLGIRAIYYSSGQSWSSESIVKRFRFSADEVGAVSFKYPLPEYYKSRIRNWTTSAAGFMALTWFLVVIVLSFVARK